MKQTVVSGLFTLAGVVLSWLLPLLLPTNFGSRPLILFSKLETSVSPDLLIQGLRGQDATFLGRRLTVVRLQNASSEDLSSLQIELRLSVDNDEISTGTRPGRSFFSSAFRITPSGDNSFLLDYSMFPKGSEQDIFLLSDDDFSVISLIPNSSHVRVLQQDEGLITEVNNRRWRHYLIGALSILGLLSAAWFVLTLFGRRLKLPRKGT